MKNRLLYVLTLVLFHLIVYPPQKAAAQITLVGEDIKDTYVSPGETYSGSVLIHNESDSTLTIRVYQDEVTALTAFDRGDRVITIDRSNAGWISHTAEKMTIQAGAIVELAYEVVVPQYINTAPPAGTYWSSLTVDVVALGASAFRRPYSRSRLVDLTTHIQGTGTASVDINALKIIEGPHDGRSIQASMVNTGDLLVDSEVWIEFYDVAGNLKDRIPGAKSRLYPGGFDRKMVNISGLKPGIYEALVIVDAGEDRVFGAQYTVDLSAMGKIAQSGTMNRVF